MVLRVSVQGYLGSTDQLRHACQALPKPKPRRYASEGMLLTVRAQLLLERLAAVRAVCGEGLCGGRMRGDARREVRRGDFKRGALPVTDVSTLLALSAQHRRILT